jgi:predicted MPP superfamily phosphohydrolase
VSGSISVSHGRSGLQIALWTRESRLKRENKGTQTVHAKQVSMSDQPIRILHLSDVHFRVGKGWDADPVLRSLARFVRSEVKAGLAPDLVVISGDLAFSGIAEEYALARDWLETQLWPALPDGLARDRLLLVPGNHDVDRTKVGKGVRWIQDGLLNACSQDDIATLLGDDEAASRFSPVVNTGRPPDSDRS